MRDRLLQKEACQPVTLPNHACSSSDDTYSVLTAQAGSGVLLLQSDKPAIADRALTLHADRMNGHWQLQHYHYSRREAFNSTAPHQLGVLRQDSCPT